MRYVYGTFLLTDSDEIIPHLASHAMYTDPHDSLFFLTLLLHDENEVSLPSQSYIYVQIELLLLSAVSINLGLYLIHYKHEKTDYIR